MAAARDYYDVLEVPKTAGHDEIRRSFRRLARAHHPDVSDTPEAEERFRELLDAYRTLSRPATKRMYDLFGYSGRGGDAAAAIDELARWLGSRRRPAEPEVVGEVALRFAEAARGGVRTVQVAARWECAACRGRGAARGSAIDRCETCAGSGHLRQSSELGVGRLLQVAACGDCGGTGRRLRRPCALCAGAGEVQGRRAVRVRVPAGVADGERVPVEVGGREAVVAVRVVPLPDDSLAVRAVAVAGLAGGLSFLAYLLMP
jgi:molecular chaperone DnaJ